MKEVIGKEITGATTPTWMCVSTANLGEKKYQVF